MLRNSLLFLLVAVASWALTQGPTRESLSLVGGLSPVTEAALRAEGVGVRRQGAILTLEISDRQAAIRALSKASMSLAFAKWVVENNLANKDYDRTVGGITPYRRQFPNFDSAGGVLGVSEDEGDFNWVYDPRHPFAETEGCYQGYRAMPNINVIQEKTCWAQLDIEQQAINLLLQRLDPSLIISPSQCGALPDPHRSFQPELTELPELPAGGLTLEILSRMAESSASLNFDGASFDSSWLVAQPNRVAAGQASVATSLNWLCKARRYTSESIDEKYGFGLLNALKSESSVLGLDWKDAGNLSAQLWPELERRLNKDRVPVILAFDGPLSPRAGGHIVMLTKIVGDQVTYADPHTGKLATTTKQQLLAAESHPDGNFVFVPRSLDDDDDFMSF